MAERTPLTLGRAFVARYKKQEYTAEVGEDNLVHVFDPNGEETGSYRSLSKAGSAVMNGIACNGWRFWKDVETEPAEEPEPTPAAPRPCKKTKKRKRASQ